jgi:hypothetical protein
VVEDAKLQHSSSVRERDDMALRTLKRTPKLYDVTQRVTANDSAVYSRAKCGRCYKGRTSPHGPRTRKVRPSFHSARYRSRPHEHCSKTCRHVVFSRSLFFRPPRVYDVSLRPSITYSIDYKEGYGVDRSFASLVATCMVFPAELFGVRQSTAADIVRIVG